MWEGIEMTEENVTNDYWILFENLYGKKENGRKHGTSLGCKGSDASFLNT